MVGLAILKQAMVSTLPVMLYSKQYYDDYWVADHAAAIRANDWLGAYDHLTLVKGPFSPFFLAVCSKLGIPFLTAEQLWHSLACLIVVAALAPLLRSSWSRIIVYIGLLFDPISWAAWTFQRVYRNGLTVSQALIVISCLCALYLRRDRPLLQRLPWSLGAGLSLATMWHNREDTAWILPFVFVATAIMLCSATVRLFFALRAKKDTRKQTPLVWGSFAGSVLVVLLPLGTLGASNAYVSHLNQENYGLSCYNEINDCHFPDFMKAIYSVKWDTTGLPERTDVPLEKLEYLYTLSPTLNSISDAMTEKYKAWAHDKGYVENGMLIWPLRDGVHAAGYYQPAGRGGAADTDRLYANIAAEIHEAISSGRAQGQPTMPSSLMPPWHSIYSSELPRTVSEFYHFVVSFQDVKPSAEGWDNEPLRNRIMLGLSGDRSVSLSDDFSPAELQYVEPVVNRLNRIAAVYGAVTPPFASVTALAWVGMLGSLLIRQGEWARRRDAVLLLTGIAGSVIAILTGVAYNQIASVKSSYYMYLSGAYPLMLLFTTVTLCLAAEHASPHVISGIARLRHGARARRERRRDARSIGQDPVSSSDSSD
ncbi:MAG: hypothetical protein LKI58_07890 [Actinomyces sp.]|jgi:hypothetical protein|nr:hypothetical protein [Actinomyces sp.]MCI1787971.1 hypothetical protein [Actinomyces sp.]MCI1830520.1 hypothetical protein [Actinomyces sp.]